MKLNFILWSDGSVDQRKDKGTHVIDKSSFFIHRLLVSLFITNADQVHVAMLFWVCNHHVTLSTVTGYVSHYSVHYNKPLLNTI